MTKHTLLYFFIFINIVFAQSSSLFSSNQKKEVIINLLNSHLEVNQNTEFIVGVKFTLKEDWHTYWKNPGDSGLPPKFEWDLPPGIEAGEINFPIPEMINFDDMVNYSYSQTVIFPVKFKINKKYEGLQQAKVKISWLVCKEICLAQDTIINFNIKFGNEKPNIDLKILNRIIQNSSIKLNNYADVKSIIFRKNSLELRFKTEITDVESIIFYPSEYGQYNHSSTQNYKITKDEIFISVPLDQYASEKPKSIDGLIILKTKNKTYNLNINSPIGIQ